MGLYLGEFVLSVKDYNVFKVFSFESGFKSVGVVHCAFRIHFFIMMLIFVVFDLEVVILIGMVLGSFLCLLQSDVKSIIAYSSVVHISFVLLVLCLVCGFGKLSGVLMMLSHGYVSTIIFYLIGEFYHILGTRMMIFISGLMVSRMIVSYVFFGIFWFFFDKLYVDGNFWWVVVGKYLD